jgi:hypothetical protein
MYLGVTWVLTLELRQMSIKNLRCLELLHYLYWLGVWVWGSFGFILGFFFSKFKSLKCTVASDCCTPGLRLVAGFCTVA